MYKTIEHTKRTLILYSLKYIAILSNWILDLEIKLSYLEFEKNVKVVAINRLILFITEAKKSMRKKNKNTIENDNENKKWFKAKLKRNTVSFEERKTIVYERAVRTSTYNSSIEKTIVKPSE